MRGENAPFPFLAPWSPIGTRSLAWSHRGCTVNCPLVGLVGERLTAGVLGTSCG